LKGKNISWLPLMALLLINVIVGIEASPSIARVHVSPSAIIDPTKGEGSTFTVKINISDVVNLYGWSIRMLFNKDLVRVTAITIPSPSFLRSAGPTQILAKKYDNVAGYALVSEMLKIPYPPVGASGSGILATISFTVVGVGVTALDLTDTKLNTVIAGNNAPIEHLVEDGLFDNRLVNLPPVAIFSVTPPIGVEGSIITFDASASHDDGWIASYLWDFGDGTNATSKVAQHAWSAGFAGVYTVTLTVADNDGVSVSGQYAVAILSWMEGGNHPDLIRTLIWPERAVFKEADFGEHETLWAKVGNPTDKSYQVRVDFDISSKDEGRKLGTISTPIETILPYEIRDMSADFFLGDKRWATTTGPYNWPYWVKKYWAVGRLYYLDEATGEWVQGIFPGANQFKVHPVTHDRAVTYLSTNYNLSNPGNVGDTVVIDVVIENHGQQIEHDVQLSIDVFKLGTIASATSTLAIGETRSFTFEWDTAGVAPGNYVIIANLDLHPYERDNIDNNLFVVVRLV